MPLRPFDLEDTFFEWATSLTRKECVRFKEIPDHILLEACKVLPLAGETEVRKLVEVMIQDGVFYTDCRLFATIARAWILDRNIVTSRFFRTIDIPDQTGDLLLISTNWESPQKPFPGYLCHLRQWLVCMGDNIFIGNLPFPEPGIYIGRLEDWTQTLLDSFQVFRNRDETRQQLQKMSLSVGEEMSDQDLDSRTDDTIKLFQNFDGSPEIVYYS